MIKHKGGPSHMNEDASGIELHENDDVIIHGVITEIDHAGNVTVDFQKKGETASEKFNSNELIKAEIDGSTITGVLGGGT